MRAGYIPDLRVKIDLTVVALRARPRPAIHPRSSRRFSQMQTVAQEVNKDVPPVDGGPFTMQIVVRRDLLETQGWGVGPLMGQVAHAASAVLHVNKDLEETKAYLSDLSNMRKVVLQTTDESSLMNLKTLLSTAVPPIPHYVWIEQPENIPTCIALVPNRKERRVKKALEKAGCRLWRD